MQEDRSEFELIIPKSEGKAYQHQLTLKTQEEVSLNPTADPIDENLLNKVDLGQSSRGEGNKIRKFFFVIFVIFESNLSR